ncbi:MAG: DUF4838 domain-containing protein [Clostridia bacterium]|nr:DUF4838 domain-containing protein [Clostridia bacterium]
MKKILCIVLVLLTLVSAVPAMAVSADEPAKSFADVKEGKWYYEGVMWCAEQGYMAGESETHFAPSKEMTRSMLVTVLAAIAGVDTSAPEYQNSPFVDVKEGKWYTGAVVWANANNIANGISDDTFGYKNPVTREQLVVMVYQFMQMQGVDVSNVSENTYLSFGDTDRVHSWAVEAMKWAVTNEIISGTGSVDGALQLSPRSTATRAQIAVIVKAMMNRNLGSEYPVGSVTLGGSDISEFTIVCGKTFEDEEANAARKIGERLASVIKNACGAELTVVNDTDLEAVEGAKEILIGKTNREDAGLLTVERKYTLGHESYYEMRGNYLIIASDELDSDTYLSASHFLEDVLGASYFGGGIYCYESKRSASLEDGVKVTDRAYLTAASSLQSGAADPFLAINDEWKFINPNHNLPTLACSGCEGGTLPDYAHHLEHYLGSNPCLTDPESIETVIKNVRYILEDKLGDNKELERYVYLNQDDSGKCCSCEHCGAAARLWGSRSAPYVQIMTYVSEALSDEYPNVKYVAYSCDHTKKAPKTADEISDEDYAAYREKYGDQKFVPAKDITPPENCVVHIKTDDTGCTSHRRDDPNCPRNVDYDERIKGWVKIYGNICLLNMSGSKIYCNNPFPMTYQLWDDFNYFSQYEQFTDSRHFSFANDDSCEFVGLTAYLNSRLFWDSDMSWNEYSEHINDYLKAAYGPGWAYVREYIDTYEKLSSANHWWTYSSTIANRWDKIITEEQWRADNNFEYCESLLDKALSLCETEEQKRATEIICLQMDYIEVVLKYREYAAGNKAAFDEFIKLNLAYRDNLEKYNLWVPDNWSEKSDPDNWTTEQ